ncbi:DNA ligase [Pararobbsia alpina]|uniref:DNA ligase n=1 Tax=Pararobbsia alpina TaxID=621374 RepID=A0A6S7B3E9_9BURK|nr:DNA ligase [Pararobbsia alpina]CAB3784169.1 DNA ligase [Pararobbsia alpina]
MPKAPGIPFARPIEASDLMIAAAHKTPFSDPEFLFEWKYDGYRCLVRKGDRIELISRNGNSLNASFPDVVDAVAAVPGSFVWDSELTVDDARAASFQHLQTRARTTRNARAAARKHPARFYVFDMLATTRDIRGLPLIERKRFLRDSFDDSDALVYASGIVGAGLEVFELVKRHGFEGMVAKRLQSTYQKGRSRDWLKIKWAGYGRQGFGRSLTPPLKQ